MPATISFNSNDELLAGEAIGKDPQLLFLHGAGGANRERARQLAEKIGKESGQGAFLFDFSGHGESSGELRQSSLKKRVDEANTAWQFLAQDKLITVLGFSMGGHIALELLKYHDIANLVLFYPGIYTQEAFDLPFDQRFSEAIRKPDSWRDAQVLNGLKDFSGNLLIIWGENDAVVPRGVVEAVYGSVRNARSRELFVVPGGEHLLLPQLYADEQLMREVTTKIEKILI